MNLVQSIKPANLLKKTVTYTSRIHTKSSRPTISATYRTNRVQKENMSSDADYEAFLNKANQDTKPSKPNTRSSFATKAVDTEVPAVLKSIQIDYVSEVDEPFEPVSLKWTKKTPPTTEELNSLLGHKDTIEKVELGDFDNQGHYKEVVTAVKESASAKDAFCYRVKHGSTRSEYYVLAVDAKESRLVGLKAKAVES